MTFLKRLHVIRISKITYNHYVQDIANLFFAHRRLIQLLHPQFAGKLCVIPEAEQLVSGERRRTQKLVKNAIHSLVREIATDGELEIVSGKTEARRSHKNIQVILFHPPYLLNIRSVLFRQGSLVSIVAVLDPCLAGEE